MSIDINKISSKLSNQLSEAKSSEQTQRNKSVQSSPSKDGTVFTDKVSLQDQSRQKNEKIFAKIEMAKLDEASFEKLKSMKAKITEYEKAKEISPEAAAQTAIGKLLNDSSVFEEIANKILK
ncbi:MAG: hypothetical protein LAT84_07330 [Balneolia bacterium]|nr:hypothetical protein [Balneolia bacterium]